MARITVTDDEVAFGLLFGRGVKLNASQLTYSRPVAGSVWPFSTTDATAYAPGIAGRDQPYVSTYSVLNDAQWGSFVRAMTAWDRLVAVDFRQVAETATQAGEIRVAFTGASMNGAAGYVMTPGGSGVPGSAVGDVWINNLGVGSDHASGGDYALLLHEIGHALGIKHPFEATGSGGIIKSPFDHERYTVMSYTRSDFAYKFTIFPGGGINATAEQVRAATPMVLDILAIQQLYGAALDTATGDDTYRFDQNSQDLLTLYDRGGTDTIDLSSHTRGSVIDLAPGSYSSIGLFTKAEQIAYWIDVAKGYDGFITSQINRTDAVAYEWRDNLGIAFDTVIENVVAGSGNDTILGNDANNRIDGGRGNDVLDGGRGNDLLLAGSGEDRLTGDDGDDGLYVGDALSAGDIFVGGNGSNDQVGIQGDYWGAKKVVFQAAQLSGVEVIAVLPGSDSRFGGSGAATGYDLTIVDANASGQLTVWGSALRSDERLRFDGSAETDARLTLYGGRGADILIGGRLGDLIVGGEGRDELLGGAGADVFGFEAAAHSNAAAYDTIGDFSFAADKLRLAEPASAFHRDANTTATLSAASIGAQLTAALGGVLFDHGVALVTGGPGGDLAGRVFAVVDMDGIAGFDAARDLVVDLGVQRVEDIPLSGLAFIA